MSDDRQFLAAANEAVRIVELLGNVPGKQKAESVGVIAFMLLDLLKSQGKEVVCGFSNPNR